MSWRIQTNLVDNSKTVSLETGALGYTSIMAQKGPNVPVKLANGASKDALELFGYPNSSYSGVQDVIDYLGSSGELYVIAPTSGVGEKYGGILVRESGTEQFVVGQEENGDLFDFTIIDAEETIGTGDGVETIFTATVVNPTEYNNNTIVVKVDGVELTTYAVTDAEPEVISADELTSGSYTRATGEISLEFISAVADGAIITVEYTYDASADTYFALFDKYPSPDEDKAVLITDVDSTGTFSVAVYLKDANGNWYEKSDSPLILSVVAGAKDASGVNIDAEVVLEDNNFFAVQVNNRTFTTFTEDTTYVTLKGGNRGDDPDDADLASGYTFAQDENTYPVNLFFDTTAEGTVATVLETIRNNYNKYARIILPTISQTPTAHLAEPSISKNSIDDRGIYFYVLHWGIHKDLYNGSSFLCSNMGLIAGKHADIIQNGYGGYSPSWIDEAGFGGQLGSSIISFTYGATEDELRQLQTVRLNPVVKDFNYGSIIKASRTSLSVESDYSYIEHSGLADYILRTAVKQIFPFVIKKPNDNAHRAQVQASLQTLGSTVGILLDDFVSKCDRYNNTDEILNQKKFVATLGVRFTPFSKLIKFNLVNSRFGLDIEESIA